MKLLSTLFSVLLCSQLYASLAVQQHANGLLDVIRQSRDLSEVEKEGLQAAINGAKDFSTNVFDFGVAAKAYYLQGFLSHVPAAHHDAFKGVDRNLGVVEYALALKTTGGAAMHSVLSSAMTGDKKAWEADMLAKIEASVLPKDAKTGLKDSVSGSVAMGGDMSRIPARAKQLYLDGYIQEVETHSQNIGGDPGKVIEAMHNVDKNLDLISYATALEQVVPWMK